MTRKRGPYISDLMIERRQKLIADVKQLIADRGPDGFTIRDLTREAGVSNTFIYRAYGDKEGVISAAIEDFYRKLPVGNRRAPATLDGVVRELGVSARTILANAAYSRAIASLYFSASAGSRIHKILQQIVIDAVEPWVTKTMEAQELLQGLAVELVFDKMATDRWTIILDWACGRLDDQSLGPQLKIWFLVRAIGLTTGAARKEAEAALSTQLTRMNKAAMVNLHREGAAGRS